MAVGEIRLFAGNFAPEGWAICDGSMVTGTVGHELFQVIGTTYGGEGRLRFALPDFRKRIPVGIGSVFARGASGTAGFGLTSPAVPLTTIIALQDVDLYGEPYLGEVRTFAFPFAPLGWASCDGQIVRADQHSALSYVIRNRFGGDGETTFGFPDMSATPAKGAAAPGPTIGTLVMNYCIATSGRFPGRG